MKILLVSGHTSGYNADRLTGVNEGDLNIELTDWLSERLDGYAEVTVYPYERDMYHDNLNGQLQVELKTFDYVLEIHFNAFNGSVNGTEIYVHRDYTGGTTVEEKILRKVTALGFANRGLKRRDDLLNMNVCFEQGVDYALLEVCFYDSPIDMERYAPIKGTVADVIVSGIVEGFGLAGGLAEIPNPDAILLREMSSEEYIEYMGRLAQADWTKNRLLPSPTVAQAIKEPGYGKSELACGLGASAETIRINGTAYGARNVFGMKKDISKGTWESTVWDGSVYRKLTSEQNADGSYKEVVADFRSYETIADNVEDRAQYLTNARTEAGELRFPGIVGETDPDEVCHIIAVGGYATSLTYEESLKEIIRRHNLTRFDPVSAYEPWTAKVIDAVALNVRQAPNGRIMDLEMDSLPRVTVIGEEWDGDGNLWYKVRVGDTLIGYVWPEYISG